MKQLSPLWLLSCLLLLLTEGCASLTKSQLSEVNAFGQLTKNFSAYPEKVISSYNSIHAGVQLLLVNGKTDTATHFHSLVELYRFKKESGLISRQIGLTLQIVDAYAQELENLTADVHSQRLDTAALALGTNLGGLISDYNKLVPQNPLPAGIGTLAGELVKLGGDIYIRRVQAEKTKEAVIKGDQLISMLAANLETFLDGPVRPSGTVTLKSLIRLERTSLETNYRQFLQANLERVRLERLSVGRVTRDTVWATRPAILQEDLYCIDLLDQMDADESLRQECLKAVKSLREAHHQLFADLEERKKLKDVFASVKSYVGDLKQMNATIKTIK